MASTARHVSGDCKPIAALCDSAYPIEVGDLLFQDPVSKKAKPASAMANQGSEDLNQDTFQQFFLGVALQKNGAQSGETLPLNSTVNHSPANTIEVATAGIFCFDCVATAWNTGDLVGAKNNAGATALENQKVKTAASASLAIGNAVPAANEINVSLTQVLVAIRSTIMDGGVPNQVAGSSSGAV
jgi:hypothetical protein